jgi:metal-responsive CopG/Arc/MetJ family transcriptional regulator
MKTAVSIPDSIFEQAELFARRAKRSRSQLFSDALAEYLARHSGDEITDAMNRVIDATGIDIDPFTSAASRRALARSEW